MYCPARRPLAQLPLPLILYCLALLRTALRAVWRVAVSAAEKRDYEAVFLACQVGVCRAGLKPKPSNRHLGLLLHHPAAHRTRFRVTAATQIGRASCREGVCQYV